MFSLPFELDPVFENNCMVIAVKADTGSHSMKATINPANVKNPQGRQHTCPLLEWDDAKDSLENCKAAGFTVGHKIWTDRSYPQL